VADKGPTVDETANKALRLAGRRTDDLRANACAATGAGDDQPVRGREADEVANRPLAARRQRVCLGSAFRDIAMPTTPRRL
jgi:hypothetical protein